GWTPDPMLRLAAIVPPDAERLTGLAARLKLSRAEAAYLAQWVEAPEIPATIAETALDRMLYRNGVQGILVRLRLMLAAARAKTEGDPQAMALSGLCQRLLARAERWSKPDFPLSGADVLAAGVPAGPRVGEILTTLEDEWVESNFNLDRASLLARLAALAK
ncbi:MAG TPA: CCA tRNA nucleotidyltransferase, partial [Mycoplana sp.]|nr:CCA tRNA nucleotidyltransferase [Mycoplana sp.]